MNILEDVKAMISDKMDIDADSINLDTTFEDIQIDSLDMVEIVMDLEDKYGITIDTNAGIKCVADLVSYIEKNTNK